MLTFDDIEKEAKRVFADIRINQTVGDLLKAGYRSKDVVVHIGNDVAITSFINNLHPSLPISKATYVNYTKSSMIGFPMYIAEDDDMIFNVIDVTAHSGKPLLEDVTMKTLVAECEKIGIVK
ncbi:MAG: hypothetical protein IJ589_03485 [Lachnospiraceae bacterium]|nr:hypothetical protein [Lachnospiraceae bacterium]